VVKHGPTLSSFVRAQRVNPECLCCPFLLWPSLTLRLCSLNFRCYALCIFKASSATWAPGSGSDSLLTSTWWWLTVSCSFPCLHVAAAASWLVSHNSIRSRCLAFHCGGWHEHPCRALPLHTGQSLFNKMGNEGDHRWQPTIYGNMSSVRMVTPHKQNLRQLFVLLIPHESPCKPNPHPSTAKWITKRHKSQENALYTICTSI